MEWASVTQHSPERKDDSWRRDRLIEEVLESHARAFSPHEADYRLMTALSPRDVRLVLAHPANLVPRD